MLLDSGSFFPALCLSNIIEKSWDKCPNTARELGALEVVKVGGRGGEDHEPQGYA